ncbi:MAG TPA: phage holin family protein [Coriobacteriia bacterium]
MVRFLIRTAITAVGVLLVAYLGLISIQGVGPGSPFSWGAFGVACAFAVVLGLVNGVIKPVVSLLTLPVTILSLGLFSLVVNLAMFYLAAAFTPISADAGFLSTALAAIVVAIFSGMAGALTKRDE